MLRNVAIGLSLFALLAMVADEAQARRHGRRGGCRGGGCGSYSSNCGSGGCGASYGGYSNCGAGGCSTGNCGAVAPHGNQGPTADPHSDKMPPAPPADRGTRIEQAPAGATVRGPATRAGSSAVYQSNYRPSGRTRWFGGRR